MSTPKLAHRMWWVGILGWLLLASAAMYWSLNDIVLTAGGMPVIILLSLLLGGGFLAGLASAWFGWFSVLTDRVLKEVGRQGAGVIAVVATLGVFLSPAALVLVLRSVGSNSSPFVFASSWFGILILLGACFGWFRRWIRGYAERAA